MKSISINSAIGNSKILIGENLVNVSEYLPENKKVVIITDEKINAVYGHQFPKADLIITIPQGESNKSLKTLEYIFDKMADAEIDRSSFVLGIGGGIVCDSGICRGYIYAGNKIWFCINYASESGRCKCRRKERSKFWWL